MDVTSADVRELTKAVRKLERTIDQLANPMIGPRLSVAINYVGTQVAELNGLLKQSQPPVLGTRGTSPSG